MSRLDVGFGCGRRCAPACDLRLPSLLADAGAEGFCPLLGGVLELSGVLGGRPSLRFKFGDPRQQRLALLGQRGYRFRLRQDQTDQRFFVERIKPFASHPKLESAPDSPVKFPNRLAKIADKNGREQLHFLR